MKHLIDADTGNRSWYSMALVLTMISTITHQEAQPRWEWPTTGTLLAAPSSIPIRRTFPFGREHNTSTGAEPG